MSRALEIVAMIAFVVFIIYNAVEIILANRFYKRMEERHKKIIDSIIDKTVDEIIEGKNEDNQ
jgi:uncharacterized SAM-binding protein YcdF (DUF218 family)